MIINDVGFLVLALDRAVRLGASDARTGLYERSQAALLVAVDVEQPIHPWPALAIFVAYTAGRTLIDGSSDGRFP